MEIHELLRIGTKDVERAAAVLARAFQNDPMMVWAIPDAEERRRILPWLIGLSVRYSCRYGEVYATQGYEGVAIWLPPGQTTLTLGRMLRVGMLAALFRMPRPTLWRLNRAESTVAALHQRCMPGEHWYLLQIGVEPSRQRRGIASRLLQPLLARIDGAGLPCYLETENAANVAFYQHHGFQVAAQRVVPNGGLRIWAMVR